MNCIKVPHLGKDKFQSVTPRNIRFSVKVFISISCLLLPSMTFSYTELPPSLSNRYFQMQLITREPDQQYLQVVPTNS